MIRNYKDEFQDFRRTAMDIVKTADDTDKHILYMSFTQSGKRTLKEMNKKFLQDGQIDFELGIISLYELEDIKKVYGIIEKSIKHGTVY